MIPGGKERLFPNTERVINYVVPLKAMVFDLRLEMQCKQFILPKDIIFLDRLFRVFQVTLTKLPIKDYFFVCKTLRVPVPYNSNQMLIYSDARAKWFCTKGKISIYRILLALEYIYENTESTLSKEDYQQIRGRIKGVYEAKKFKFPYIY